MKLLRSTFLVLGMLLLPAFLLAQDTASHTKAALVSSVDTVQAGEEFWLALRLESQPHWHTYWINPGEAGFPTELIWEEKPEGIEIADTFTWPAPVYYLQGGIVSHVYEGEVFLLLRARAAANLEAGKELVFKARADWLECDDKGCWPGGADVSLTLRSAATATVTATAQAAAGQTAEGQKADASPWAEKIAQTLAALPTALPQAWSAQAEQTSAGVYKLTLTPAIAAVASSADVSASSASASSADVAADTVGAAGLAGSAANTPNTAAQPIHFFPLSDDLLSLIHI